MRRRRGAEEARNFDENAASQFFSTHCEVNELKLLQTSRINFIIFESLNTSFLKKAGMIKEDELRQFASQRNFKGTTSDINIAGPLWTGRETGYIGIEEVARHILKDSTLKAIELLHK